MQIGSITYNIMNKDRPSKHVYTWWGLQCGELLWSFVFPYGLKKHARQKLSRSAFSHIAGRGEWGGTDPHRDPQLLGSDLSAFVAEVE